MNNDNQSELTPEELKRLAKSFGKPVSPSLRDKVMKGIDEIDRKVEREGPKRAAPDKEPPKPKRGR